MPFFFVIFCFEKCAKMPIFIVFFEKQPKKCKKKCPKKNDNFWHFAKHRFIKKTRFVATPLFLKKCVFQLGLFWNQKQWCWTKNITQNQEKKQRKGKEISKRKQDRKPKKENILMKKKKFQFNIFMLFFSRNKSTEDRTKKETKTRKKKKAKKERQEGRKKDKSKTERQRKTKWKRGRPKKVKGERKGNTENKPKNALFRGKNRCFSIKNKERKGSKKKKRKQKKENKQKKQIRRV